MNNYVVVVRLLTEAIFGSGYSIPGSVDLEIVCDEYGFPYMKAKTFKGNLREEVEKTIQVLGEEYKPIICELLGEENQGDNMWRNLKFSDCRLREGTRKVLEYAVNSGEIHPWEIKGALTDIRKFTSIDENGSAAKGTLRQIRVIKRGLEFEVQISCERELREEELGLLAIGLKSLRHIGSMRTRGKGEVECTLHILEDNEYKDITDYYVDRFLKGVNFGE
ncbi:hypothetical protein K8M07_11110 [Schnuerera sp. xch1]|uniref:RAMP superfamily CRISPR-associated protein n=1 Tax=Schnuerera sp. xch1 TaxID=2874283 RepID=UPI001CBEF354|nr:RAMP superfamily CRISPR-associated protein [Schnuerera sp. xch1]MBZ2175786.1 hypothetical protein [Schnuerera sp. xch1]